MIIVVAIIALYLLIQVFCGLVVPLVIMVAQVKDEEAKAKSRELKS